MPEALPETGTDPFENTQYRSVRRLDAGGMGEVFLVEHRHLQRQFVAKILRESLAAHPQVVDRMRLEAQALGRLNHPNIVSISGFGTSSDGRPFLIMEYLQGRSLREELARRGALPPGEAVALSLEILSGLAAAHALGVVHRDIKPDNLFIAEQPNGACVLKILDFGIARVLPDAPTGAPRPLALPTESGAVIGTPRFLSPEAAVGQRVDTRADLYCAALVLYTMLAGRGPFDHIQDRERVMRAHVDLRPEPPSRYAPHPVPAELDDVVERALAKDPASRFQSAEELALALGQAAKQLGLSPRPAMLTTAAIGPIDPIAPPGAGRAAPRGATAPPGAPAGRAVAPSTPAGPSPLGRTGETAPPPAGRRHSTGLLAAVFLLGMIVSAAVAASLVAVIVGAP